MTLNVTSSEIQIKNSAGVVKFTSANKLVYQKYYQTGSITVGSGALWVPFTSVGSNDFLAMTINITSGTGQTNLISPMLGLEQPANGSILVDFYGRNVSNQAAADSEHLGVDVIGSYLVFKTVRFTNTGVMGDGTTSNNITYKARIMSFL